MPPGRFWPKRLRSKPVPRRHRIEVSFGEPITATGDAGSPHLIGSANPEQTEPGGEHRDDTLDQRETSHG